MSSHGHATLHSSRRLRMRLAVLVFLSITCVGLVASGAIGQEVPGLDPDPDETSSTTAPDDSTTSTSEAPTTTEFLETTTTDGSPSTTGSASRSTTTAATEVEDLEELDEVDDILPSDTSSTTRSDLLVAGDGTEGAESTTTTAVAAIKASSGDRAVSEETMLWMIVGGLVVVALLIGAWTVRFWRATRPESVVEDDPGDPTTVFG